jgi:hypothetical protein
MPSTDKDKLKKLNYEETLLVTKLVAMHDMSERDRRRRNTLEKRLKEVQEEIKAIEESILLDD